MKNIAARKPIGNFFVKKSLQLRLIFKIVGAVMLTTVVSCFSVLAVYYFSYTSLLFYSLDKTSNILEKQNILSILLPVLLISIIANLALALGIGFYASRKYAIPIFKLEQWASLLLQGKLTAVLHFREKEEMIELTSKCNHLTNYFLQHFLTIKRQVEALKETHQDSPAIQQIEKSLKDLDLNTEEIAVNTGFYQKMLRQENKKS
jgi:methyl-accepting chemotaxis protein